MQKLNYCLDCQRVFTINDKCEYCNSTNIKELKRGKSVNVIGSKSKGNYLRYKEGKVSLIIYTEDKLEISDSLLKEILSKKYYKTIVMVDSWLANAGEIVAQTGYDDINILGFDLMPQNKEALKQ